MYGQSIVNIFMAHPDWIKDPEAHRGEIEETARKYLCTVMDYGKYSRKLIKTDFRNAKRWLSALDDFKGVLGDGKKDGIRIEALKIFLSYIRTNACDLWETIDSSKQKAAKKPDTRNDFKVYIVGHDKEKVISVLRDLLKNKKGKGAAAVMLAANDAKIVLEKPPFKAIEATFGNIGSKQGYNDYFNRGKSAYREGEIEQITEFLKSRTD